MQVISALADKAQGKTNVLVPYRDSVLTKLLQNAIGGNSRTIMVAAISPAAVNYEETMSTLRCAWYCGGFSIRLHAPFYLLMSHGPDAERTKKITNRAVVNESPTDKLIRELKEENAKLMQMLARGGAESTDAVRRLGWWNVDLIGVYSGATAGCQQPRDAADEHVVGDPAGRGKAKVASPAHGAEQHKCTGDTATSAECQ